MRVIATFIRRGGWRKREIIPHADTYYAFPEVQRLNRFVGSDDVYSTPTIRKIEFRLVRLDVGPARENVQYATYEEI